MLSVCCSSFADSLPEKMNGVWIGSLTSASTGEKTPIYGFILDTREFLFFTDSDIPKVIFGSTVFSDDRIFSEEMKVFEPTAGKFSDGTLLGQVLKEGKLIEVQFLSNQSDFNSTGSLTIAPDYRTPSSITIFSNKQNKNINDKSIRCRNNGTFFILTLPNIKIDCQ